jgi:predicted alpha/beta hydrolase
MNHYVNADLKLIDIDPDEFNLRAIGHMGYFRRGSEELWNLVFEDLEKLNA